MSRHSLVLSLVAAVAVVQAGCGPSTTSWLRDDWATQPASHVKRLHVAITPLPNGDVGQGQLWGLLAKRYLNQQRNFLVKQQSAAPGIDVTAACAGFDGVLVLAPTAVRSGDAVTVGILAKLLRCSDREPAWTGRVSGTWPASEPTVAALREHYVAELGAAVEPWVAPAFLALKALVAMMPQPVLGDADEMEKIELGE